MTEPIRVAIAGAAGQISYALMFRIAAGGMFGPDRPVELRLLETPKAMPLLETTVKELHDCSFPLLSSVRGTVDAHAAFDQAEWIILLASAPYRSGITRSDLLRANAPIFQQQGCAIAHRRVHHLAAAVDHDPDGARQRTGQFDGDP